MRDTREQGRTAPLGAAGDGLQFAALPEPFGHAGREVHELLVRAACALHEQWRHLVHERAVSATVRALSSLDERTLDDIGLRRADIERVARESSGDVEWRTAA